MRDIFVLLYIDLIYVGLFGRCSAAALRSFWTSRSFVQSYYDVFQRSCHASSSSAGLAIAVLSLAGVDCPSLSVVPCLVSRFLGLPASSSSSRFVRFQGLSFFRICLRLVHVLARFD